MVCSLQYSEDRGKDGGFCFFLKGTWEGWDFTIVLGPFNKNHYSDASTHTNNQPKRVLEHTMLFTGRTTQLKSRGGGVFFTRWQTVKLGFLGWCEENPKGRGVPSSVFRGKQGDVLGLASSLVASHFLYLKLRNRTNVSGLPGATGAYSHSEETFDLMINV